MNLVSLLIVVVVICLVVWAIQTLTAAFAIPSQIRAVILVIVVVICVLWLLSLISGTGPVLRIGGR
jgi:hypothetical protein